MKSRISSVFSTFLQISRPQKKSQTYSNSKHRFDEIHGSDGRHEPKNPIDLNSSSLMTNSGKPFFFLRLAQAPKMNWPDRKIIFLSATKYWMQTYQASVRISLNGRNQVVKTEVRAMNAQDARWLLWAQYGFHSIQVGPSPINIR